MYASEAEIWPLIWSSRIVAHVLDVFDRRVGGHQEHVVLPAPRFFFLLGGVYAAASAGVISACFFCTSTP